MRIRLRAAGFFALAVVAITCTDAPTSPRNGRNGAMTARHLSMSPSFSPAAAQVYGNLAAFGIQVTEVHIHLTGPDGSIRDTTIAFPAGQDTLVIDIPVDAGGTDQTYTALLELRNDEHMVLFSGTQSVVARTGSFVTDVPPVIPLSWIGPGSRTKTVTVGPGDTSVTASATIPTRATAIDTAGAPVTDLLVRWTSSDATLATATSTGNATASVVGQGRRGVATISAITPSGITGISRFTFVPPPTRVAVVSGGGQTGVAGSLLAAPLVVEVLASDNLPVAGAPVTFRAVTAGGSVTTAIATSDAVGRASTTLTLGKTGGTYKYEAISGVLPAVSVSQTATPAPPAALAIVSGNAQTDSVGRALATPLVVKVTDQYGGSTSGTTVTWARVAGSGTVGAATSSAATDGLASTTYTLGNTVGGETISATIAGLTGPVTTTFNATAISRGAAAIALVSGGGQSGAPGVTLATPLVVRVADALNNPVANASVAWTTPSVGTTFTPATAVTDALGLVSTTVKLGTAAGPVVASATTATLVATANLAIVAGPAAIIAKISGDAQTTEVATNVPVSPSAKVTDASGNAIAGSAVVFSAASGGGSVTAATTATDASGVATVGSWKLGNTVGANTLTATAGALSTTFTATAKSGSAAKLALVTAAPASITVGGGIPLISARITDALDNAVAQGGTAITATGVVTPGGGTTSLTATTDATGLATFTLPPYVGPAGTMVITLSAPSLSSVASSPITVSAGAPAKLVIATQPSATVASGAVLALQPVIQLTDAGGNGTGVAGVSVTASIGTGGGTLSGTQTRVSGADGVITFTNLAISGTTGARTLTFSATGLTAATSGAISLGAGVAATMAKNAGDAQSATAGTTLPVAPSVVMRDAAGNPVAGAAVTFAVATGGGSVTAATATTDVLGVASVGSWKLGDAVGPNTLTAASGAFTATFTATGGAGIATKLAYVIAPPATITVGAAIPAISGRITDALNNPVATAGVTLTATAVHTPGGQVTTFAATTDATGLATFTPPQYDGSLGSIVLTLSSPGLTSIASSPFTVIVGAPAKLAIKTQPPASAASGAVLGVQPVLQLTDAGDNPTAIAGTTVTAFIGTGGGSLNGTPTATSAADGSVSFTNLAITGTAGNRTLGFSANGLTGISSSAIAVGAGAAAAMVKNAGDAQTATAGSILAIAPSVVVRDAAGNPVAGAPVTFAVTTGGGKLTTASPTTNALGIATVGSWTLGSIAGTNTIMATSGALSATFTAAGLSGAASKLAFVTVPPTNITVGAVVPTFTVQIADALNNAVASPGVPVTATGVTTPGGFTTSFSATTDAAGLATFALPAYSGPVGTVVLTMSAGTLTSIASSPITANVGAPAKLSITNQPSTTASSSAVFAPQPVLQLTDAGGNPVSASIGVTASIATGGGSLTGTTTVTSTASGVVTFLDLAINGTAGAHTLAFNAIGLTGATSNSIALTFGVPTVMTKIAGDVQTAIAGSTLAVQPSVLITDAAGNPVNGAPVLFTASSGGGSRVGSPTSTNASGIATVGSWTLGTTPGTNTLTVTSNALTTSFTATATVGPATQLLATGVPTSVKVGAAITPSPLRVQVADALGNVVSTSTPVTIMVAGTVGPSLTTFTSTANTDASGVASFALAPYIGPTGTLNIRATSGALTEFNSISIPVITGDPSALAITTQPSATAISGAILSVAPTVQLVDAGGNAVSQGGLTVTAVFASGTGGSLSGQTASTNSGGLATFSALAISAGLGPRTLRFSSGSLVSPASGTIDIVAGAPATIAKFLGDAQAATAGSAVAVAPQVRVFDASGNPVAGVSVTFGVTAGGGSVTGTNPINTDASGFAAIGSWIVGSTAGPNALTATAGGMNAVFTATGSAGAPAGLRFVSGLPSTITVGAPIAPISVQVIDAANNPVATSGVSLAFTGTVAPSGTSFNLAGTTDAAGRATFSPSPYNGQIGSAIYSVSGAALSSAESPPIPVAAGAFARLRVTTHPSSTAESGVAFAVQPQVQMTDAGSNPIAGALNIVAVKGVAGSYAISGTATVATDPTTGIATFTDLSFTGLAGVYSLRFTVSGGGPISPNTTAITLTAGVGSVLAIATQPSSTATNGVALATPPVIQLQDVSGNPVAGPRVTVRASISSGSGSLANASAVTDGTGKATFTGLAITGTGGNYTLNFDAPSYATVASNTIGLGAGVAAKLLVTTGFSDGQSGVPFPTQPVVRVLDSGDNPVSQAGIPVSVAIATGGGTLSGTNPVSTIASGVATFTDLVVTGAAGSRTFRFSAPGLATINSLPINLTAGAVASLAITTAPPATAQNDVALTTQPVIQLLDAANNPVPTAGISIFANLDQGGSTRNQTATTDASGAATFNGLAIQGLVGTYTIAFSSSNESLPAVHSGTITLSAGLPVQMAFLQQPTSAVQNVAIAPPVTIQLQDDIGNLVTTGGFAATVSLLGGDASLAGTLTEPFVSGIATFSDLRVSLPFSNYQLAAITIAPGVANVTSSGFAITPAGQPGVSVASGSKVVARPNQGIPAGTITFRVRDGSLQPIPGAFVRFSSSTANCTYTPLTTTTDNAGNATLGVTLGNSGEGCFIGATATGVELSAYAQVVSVPFAASHAWIGGDPSGSSTYEVKGNWLDMESNTPQLPSINSVAYVANWGTETYPRLSNDQSIGGIIMDGGAFVDLAGKTLTTSRNIDAQGAWFFNGPVVATGSGVNISGAFDALTLGRAGSCTSGSPEFANLRNVIVRTSMTVACGANVDNAQDSTITSLPGSFVKVNDGGILVATTSAAFNGDSLVIGSGAGLAVYGNGAFAGRLGMVAGSSLYMTGAAEFTGFGNTSGGGVDITGDVTFVGSGRLGYTFDNGGMNLYGNFAQKGSGSAFNATLSQHTYFGGSTPQSISMEQPDANGFGTVFLQNDGGGVTLLSDLTFHANDPGPALYVYYSPLTVPKGVTLTQTGQINFISGGGMLLDGVATYLSCTSTQVVAPISGSGTANGAPASEGGRCSLGGGGGGGQGGSLSAAQGAVTSVQPVIIKPVPRPFPSRPVVLRTTTRKLLVR